jgi:hypothetical protein
MTKMIAFTFNPHWIEIEEELQRTGETLQGHVIPDNVMATVFNIKLRHLLRNLVQHSIMGRVRTYKYTIEFQRRGLPMAFIVLNMECTLNSAIDIVHL